MKIYLNAFLRFCTNFHLIFAAIFWLRVFFLHRAAEFPRYATDYKNHTFHYTRRNSAKGNTATCVDVEAVANRLQRCVRFSRSRI